MRVPVPWVIVLSFAVIISVWLYGSRNADFLTPPSDAKLADIKARVQSSLPRTDPPENAVSPPVAPQDPAPLPPPPEEPPKPAIILGDLSRPPSLQEYSDRASQDAALLIDLASALEAAGEFQRALLAWERVLDTGKPDETQTNTAVIAIKRLRLTLPDWNTDAAKSIPIILHAGTGKKTATLLAPILEETAREIQRASAGILKVTCTLTKGRETLRSTIPPPVALWFTGPTKNSRSTDVLSFTVASKETLHDDVRKTAFLLIRSHLGRNTSQIPPPPIARESTPLDAINNHITRLSWQELGNNLKLSKKKPE